MRITEELLAIHVVSM